MPNMNHFFLSSLPVLLLNITVIVCVSFILQSTESLCSHLTPADKRFVTGLKAVHSHTPLIDNTLQYEAQCWLSFSASLKSKTLLKVRVIFVQVGVRVEGAKCRSDSWCPGTAWHKKKPNSSNKRFKDGRSRGGKRNTLTVRQDMLGDLGVETDLKMEFNAQVIKLRS